MSDIQPLYQLKPDNFDPIRTHCDLCGSSAITLHHTDWRGNQIYRCSECQVQFQNPQYSLAYLGEYYSQYTKPKPEMAEGMLASHRYRMKYVRKYADKPGVMLDVGCAKGELIEVAREQGWQADGYDVDPDTCAAVAQRINATIFSGLDFAGIDWQGRQYDALVMAHVIEHLKSPHPYFETFDKILKPGGLLVIAAPNLESFSSRFKLWQERMGLRKKKIGDYYDTDHHLWYYGPHSIRYLLDKYGYEILHIRADRGARRLKTRGRRIKKWLLGFLEPFFMGSTFMVIARKKQ